MNPVTQSEIKTLTGLSKQFISRQCAAGLLTMCMSNNKKMVDLDGHLTIEWLKTKRDRIEGKKDPIIPISDKLNHDLLAPSNSPSGLASTGEKKKLSDQKLVEQIEEIQIKNQIKRADLVQKKTVIKVFNRFYGIHETQLKSIGINAGPKISTVYNKSNAVKTFEILKLLEREDDKPLRTELTKVMNSGESERINSMNQILEDATGSILKSIQIEIDKFLKHVEELKKI